VVSFTPLPLYPRERATGTHFIGGWVDPRAGLDDMENFIHYWTFFEILSQYTLIRISLSLLPLQIRYV
jgi:hypothetical protein